GGAGYELVVGPGPRAGLERLRARVERGLGENFYYGHGRRMGQLRPLALRIVGSGRAVHPGPLSTAKPHFLKVNS
ncbi:MAG TPA: hypothetical protein VNI01_15985, partial [Elusimicrobiota bacterium]|nr:hypothetical protein [Elusimicrobiota bacterium]